MDSNESQSNPFGVDVRSLGYSPATSIGNQSLADVREQIINSTQLLTMFQPQAITNANVGANSINDPAILTMGPNKLINGYVQGQITVGPPQGLGGILIDGTNKQIVITDETGTPRVLIGLQTGGF